MDRRILNTLLLADGRLPTGAYSHSAGLEPAVMAGLTKADVHPYMLARVHSITRLECASCVLAHRLAVSTAPVAAYARLESAVEARTPSAAQRDASRALGRALLRLAKSLRPAHPGVVALGALDTPPMRGVTLGVIGAALDIREEACAEICCYEDLQTVAAAALKLLPVDPVDATRWVVDAGSAVADVVDSVLSIRDSAELPAISAPWIEHWAETHSQRTRRLFVA